jgi:DNA-binding transcriptional LysR family regulator
MLNLSRLRTLHELARLGTVGRVASSLSYSPSAVSQQLAQLEKEVGVTLTEQVGRRLVLTDAGRVLAEHARSLLEGVERAEAEVAATRPVLSGVLRVASFQSVMLSLIPPALTVLYERHPELQVEVHQREVEPAYAGLLSHEFDLVLGEEYPGMDEPQRPGVQREPLLEDPLLLAVPRTGPWAGVTDPRELAEANWTSDPETVMPGIWARSRIRSLGIEPRVRFETIDLLLQAHLVRSGHAVGILPALVAREHLRDAELLELPGAPHRRLHTAVRTGRSSHPAIRALRDSLGEAAAALAGGPLSLRSLP